MPEPEFTTTVEFPTPELDALIQALHGLDESYLPGTGTLLGSAHARIRLAAGLAKDCAAAPAVNPEYFTDAYREHGPARSPTPDPDQELAPGWVDAAKPDADGKILE